MKLFLVIGILLGVAGCYSASKSQPLDLAAPKQASQSFFEIKGSSPNGAVTPVFKEEAMIFGELKVAPWPVSALSCAPCEVDTGREFHPDGPTQWLVIKGSRHSTLLISSYQLTDYIKPWHFTYKQGHFLIENKESGVASDMSYDETLPKLISGSNCQLVWLKREAQVQPSVHISSDVAGFKTQFVLQCAH